MVNKQKILRVLNDKELNKIKDNLDNDFHLAIIKMLSNTGLRVSELVSLSIKDVCYDDLTIKDGVEILGKGKKHRFVPLNQKAKESIFVLIQDSKGKLKNCFDLNSSLVTGQRRSRMSRIQIYRIIKSIEEKLGIKVSLHPHLFRHQYATQLLRAGNDFKDLQDILGHSTIQTTINIYTHKTQRELIEASNKVSIL